MWPMSPKAYETIVRWFYYGYMVCFAALATMIGLLALGALKAGLFLASAGFLAELALCVLLMAGAREGLERGSDRR